MATECEKENELAESMNKSSAQLPDDLETSSVKDMDDDDSSSNEEREPCPRQPIWKVGETVLCKDGKYKIPYEAKIIEIVEHIDQLAYKIKFKGFGERFNEEFCEADALDYFLAPTAENRREAREIKRRAEKAEKDEKRRISNRKASNARRLSNAIRASSARKVSNARRVSSANQKTSTEEFDNTGQKTPKSNVRTSIQPMIHAGLSDASQPVSATQSPCKKRGWPKGKKRNNANVEAAHKTEENMDYADTPVRTGIQQMTFTDVSDTNDISNDVKPASRPVSAKNTSGRGWKRKIVNEEPAHKMDDNLDSADPSANGISQLAIIDEPESSKQKLGKRRRSNFDQVSQPVAVEKNDELIAVPRPSIPLFAPEEEVQSAAPEPIILPEKLKMVLEVDKRQAGEKSLPAIPARFTVEEILEDFCKLNSQEEKYRVFRKDLLDLFNSRFEKDVISNFESPMHQDIRSNVGYYFYGLERFLPAHLKNDVNKQNQGPSEMSKMFGLPHLLRFLTKFHETVERRKDKSANLLLCISDFVQFLDELRHLYFDESKDYYPAAFEYYKRTLDEPTYNWL